MELSSPRFTALAVSAGFSLWFFIITSIIGVFSIEIFLIFVAGIFILMQVLALKVAKALEVFAIFNTKVFLGILFLGVISWYGIVFRILHIDLLRLKRQKKTYWLEIDKPAKNKIFKQY